MKESTIQTQLIAYLRAKGYYVVKTVMASRAGVPDILVCIEGRFVGIEVKLEKNPPTRLQKYNFDLIEKAGGTAWVIHSITELKLHLAEYLER